MALPEATIDIQPGGIYEDCHGHPVLCTENDGDQLSGISLLDGTWPRGCSIACCAPEKMTLEEAIRRREERGFATTWRRASDISPS